MIDHSSPGSAEDPLSVEAVFARVEKMILLADGDRDHGNQSALKCNDTMVALHLLRHLMDERLVPAQEAGIGLVPAQEAAPRVPKVRTSHHRNAEEAIRLQALVDVKYNKGSE